jgi:galactose mutarotase-like enzyme
MTSNDAPDVLAIGSEELALTVLPDDGGKVATLTCRRHDRQWLAPERPELAAADDGSYGPREAWGWDELFPSVLTATATPAPWPHPLRDHGELWGRPWRVTQHEPSSLTLAYVDDDTGFRLERTLDVERGALRARYALSSTATEPLPYQWSLHPIFALAPGERVELAGIDRVKATVTGHHALPDGPAVVDWPRHDGLDLGTVRPSDGETFLKLYADLPTDGTTVMRGGPCELSVTTDPAFAPYIGLYLNYGGWPADGPLHHVGIEPTTSPHDDLNAAAHDDAAAVLAPGERRTWEIRMSLGADCLTPEVRDAG